MTNNQSHILVSICCITYNHAPFVGKAIEGFLMQEPPMGVSKDEPWYEILIHDDASTDGTTEIIKEYAAKYPDKIFPLYETENQYKKVGTAGIDLFNYNRAHGKYIAYCEGDDCWMDSHKLQKQVDFMESHHDYSVCFHDFRNYDVNKNKYIEVTQLHQLLKEMKADDGVDLDLETYFRGWFTQPMTMLFRVSMYDFQNRARFNHFRDMHEIYFLMKNGKCRLMNFDGGVRHIHEGGIASMISYAKYCDISLPTDREFYWKTLDRHAKKQYVETLDECVRAYHKSNKFRAFRCAIIRFLLSGHPRTLARHTKMIMGK